MPQHVPRFDPITEVTRSGVHGVKYLAACSCGWRGPQPRAKKDAAKAEALWHATHQGGHAA